MRDFDESNITQAVLERVAQAPETRMRQISDALVRHLHAFVREIEPTQEEWEAGIAFLTRTGAMCSDTRQEFILLSDTLGVSMLVDAINHRSATPGVTPSTVLGPFFVQAAPEMPFGADIAGGLEGEPLLVTGTVRSGDGAPLAGATVDVWHSDDEGTYDVQRMPAGGLAGRARFRTDGEGRFAFRSIKPAAYPIPHDGPVGDMLAAQGRHPWRPAHVHFMIQAPDHRRLVTHIFEAGDGYLDSDVVFGVKNALVAPFERDASSEAPSHRLHYDFGLQPVSGP